MFFAKWCKHKEAYVVQALLSYSRRYWRNSLKKRKCNSPEAIQLQAVCRPNARRARESCKKRKNPGQPCFVDSAYHFFCSFPTLTQQFPPLASFKENGRRCRGKPGLYLWSCVITRCYLRLKGRPPLCKMFYHSHHCASNQVIASSSDRDAPAVREPTRSEIIPFGPDMDVKPSACSQIDVDTRSKQIAIQQVMDMGYDYTTSVTMLGHCDGNVARVAERLDHLRATQPGRPINMIYAPPCSSWVNPYCNPGYTYDPRLQFRFWSSICGNLVWCSLP